MKFSKILTKQNYFIMIFLLLIILIASFSPSPLSSNKENAIPPAQAATEPTDSPTNDGYWTDAGNYSSSFSGSGIESNPYKISTQKQLAGLAYLVNNGNETYQSAYYQQTADLDMSDYWWVPIGTSASRFTGFYDGGNHTISGLFTESSSNNYQGLFGYAEGRDWDEPNEISNLSIIDSVIQGGTYVGTFGGYFHYMNLTNCYSSASVSGNGTVGGLVGNYASLLMTNCHNSGDVTGGSNTGGLVGDFGGTPFVISYSYNTGNVSGGSYVGGITGRNDGGSYVEYCFNTGSISGRGNVGGIVGSNGSNYSCVRYCYNTGDVTGTLVGNYSNSPAGGIIGKVNSRTYVYNCYNKGNVTGLGVIDVGGVAGENNAQVTNCFNVGKVSGESREGGVVGYNFGGTTRNCYWGVNCDLTVAVGGNLGNGSYPNCSTVSESNVKSQSWYTNNSNWNFSTTYVWDFTNTWAISSSRNDGYPYLRYQTFSYNIVYDFGEGSRGTYAPTSGTIGSSIRISNPIAPSGYRFDGWKAKGLNTNTAMYGSSSSSVTTPWTDTATLPTSQYFKSLAGEGSTITLTAQYSGIPYNITYNRNGGSGGTSPPNNVSYGVEFTVTAPTPPAGYNFTGWTGSGLSSTALNNGRRWTGSLTTNGRFSNLRSNGGTATITANYSPVSYTINFNEDGGATVNNISYNITSTSTLPSTTKAGYTFGGWRVTSQSGNWTLNGIYPAGYSLNGKYGSPTLTAVWTPIDCKITFLENGGTAVTDIYYTIEDTITLPTTTRTGYNFSGWLVMLADGNFSSNETFSSGASLTNRYGNVTMTAQWTPKTYNITFNANEGKFSDNSTTKSFTMRYMTEDYYLLGTFIPTREGYDFTGWYTSSGIRVYDENGEAIPGTAYWNSSQQWIYDGITTFYARYTESTYTVTLDANGGTVSPPTIQVKCQDTFGQLPIPTKLGYNFTGWYYLGNEITETSVYTYTSNITLTANWQSTWYDNAVSPSGEGTQDSPYLISSPENLAWIAREVANGRHTNSYFKQIANIDATSNQWYSIGTSSYPFTGTYEGNGYMISYRQEGSKNEYGGLFGYTNNANISRVYLTTTAFSGESAGALVGYAISTIVDSSFITVSSMTQTGRNLAYIVGYANNATITDCLLEVTNSSSLQLTNGTATTTCIYSVNGDKGYTGTDFSNYYYYEGITYPMPSKLFWIAQAGEGMTLQDVQNWVNS